jgi:hypothetical protein
MEGVSGWRRSSIALRCDIVCNDRLMDWFTWLAAATIAVAIVFFQGRWLTPNIYTVPLGRCDVDWHVDRGIVAVACIGQDLIKVWPLPVEQPW